MRIEGALRPLDDLFRSGALGSWIDEELLDRFVAGHEEAAFAALVQRHGPMVRRVCRDTLGDPHEAEDAFQQSGSRSNSEGLLIRLHCALFPPPSLGGEVLS